MEFEKRTELMRRTRSHITAFSYVNTIQELVQEDRSRVALIIGVPSTGTLVISQDPNMVSPNGFLIPNSSTVPLVLNLWDHGDIVTKRFFAVSSAGAGVVGLIETFADGW